MSENPSSSETSIPAVENESEALGYLFDVLSVLQDQSITYQIAGQGFTDSLNLAIYQLKGIPPSTATDAASFYTWATVSRKDYVERVADLAIESVDLILAKQEDA